MQTDDSQRDRVAGSIEDARPMNLRTATPTDVETLFEIRCSVNENFQSRSELQSIGVDTASVSDMLASEDYFSIIAESKDKAVGFAMAQISEAYVFACFVRPEFEGQGAGRRLLEAVETKLAEAGVKQAWLSTDANPAYRARGFYRRLGWREAGQADDGEIRLVKDLRPD